MVKQNYTYQVIRDCGYGQVWTRLALDEERALQSVYEWQREGRDDEYTNSGEWFIRPIIEVPNEVGGFHAEPVGPMRRVDVDCVENSALSAELDEEFGWVIERADSPTSLPRYWAGSAPYAEVADARRSSSWTENHEQAIRFARKLDAWRVANRCMRGVPIRVAMHIWGAS